MSRDPRFSVPEFPHCQGCGRELKTGEDVWASDWTVISETGPHLEIRYTCDDCNAWDEKVAGPPIYGMCTACGSVEVALVKATGTRDLSAIGEHPNYPTGYGCEVCT